MKEDPLCVFASEEKCLNEKVYKKPWHLLQTFVTMSNSVTTATVCQVKRNTMKVLFQAKVQVTLLFESCISFGFCMKVVMQTYHNSCWVMCPSINAVIIKAKGAQSKTKF